MSRSDWLLLAGLLVATAVVGLVLAAGHVSAFLLGGGWPSYRAVDIPGILWRLSGRPSDPAAAWEPVNTGGAVPGAAAWWATLVVLIGLLGVSTVLVRRTLVRRREAASGRWARSRELRSLRLGHKAGLLWLGTRSDREVFGSRSARLVLGTCGGRKVAVESQHSLLVFGPTQSGKTTGLAVPAILEWPGPVVTTSIKGDLIDSTIGWRSRLGKVWVFDPAASTRHTPAGWSPLATCDTWEAASRTGWDLAMAGKAAVGGGMNLADFWFSSAAKALGPYLYAAAASGRSIADVTRWVEREERGEVTGILRHLDPDAVTAHEATHRREDRARSALFQVMQEILAAYRDPTVAKSAEQHDIDPAALLDGKPNTLYVASPYHDQARLRPLFAALLGQVVTAVHKHAAATNAPPPAPILVVLDEAANIAPVDDLPTLASTGAALGIQLVTVFQDMAQIRDRYGATAGTIVNNHRAKLMLPGVSDVDTLDLFSRLAGEEEIDRDSITRDEGGPRSATTSTQWRRLLPPELARQLRAGKGVLLYGNLPPIQLRLRPWYRNRSLRSRAAVARLDQDTARPQPAHTEPAAPAGRASAPIPRTAGRAEPVPDPADRAGNGHPRPPERVDDAEPGLPPNATALDAARARLRQSRPTPPASGGDE